MLIYFMMSSKQNPEQAFSIFETGVQTQTEIMSDSHLETYHFPESNLRVEVISSTDPRVEEARQIEAEVMAALGDPIEEVIEEFKPHNESSIYFLAFDESDKSGSNIAAMGRIIPYDEEHGNKTLEDLAIIPNWQAKGVKSQKVTNMGGEVVNAHNPESVVEAFQKESGCRDLTKVWDISTVAPNFKYVSDKDAKPAVLVGTVLSAVSKLGIEAWSKGELTHVTSFNQEHAHGFFVDKLGYPFHKMFNLEPMKYDSFGSDEGMVAQPAWFSLEEFVSKIKKEHSDKNSYIGRIALGTPIDPEVVDKKTGRPDSLAIAS